MQPPAPQPLPGVSHVIAVGSGKGGVGKTTVAVNLAVALSKLGYKVGLIDADIYGPNVPMMLGVTRQPNIVGENRIEPIFSHGVKFISVGLISPGDKPMVMRGPMLHQIIRQFLQQVEWGELDFLLIDLPPGTGDVVISLVQTVPLTGAVVVSTPSDVSLQDARKALEMFHQVKVEVIGIVENMTTSPARTASRSSTSFLRAAPNAQPPSSASNSSARSNSTLPSARAETPVCPSRSPALTPRSPKDSTR
jgi:ATP-binding protein involved in chromosome partitioning